MNDPLPDILSLNKKDQPKEVEESFHKRNFGIDLLRGLSILFVVIHHLALPFRLPLKESLVGEWIGSRMINGISFHGYEAVFVFFVLSGFLITQRSLIRYKSLEFIDWKTFYLQRFSRICPLLFLLLITLSVLHFIGIPGYVISEHNQTLGRAILSALGFHLNWYEAQTSWLPGGWDVLWSLSIEEVFYLTFPLFCITFPRRFLALSLTLLAFSLPWTRAALDGDAIWQEKAYLPGMSAIAFGVLAALFSKKWTPTFLSILALAMLGMTGLVSVFFYDDVLWPFLHHHMISLLCLSSSMMLIAADHYPINPIYGFRWLAKMGFLSYEIYLSHMFIVLSVCSVYRFLFEKDMTWNFVCYVPSVLFCYRLAVLLENRITRASQIWLNARLNWLKI